MGTITRGTTNPNRLRRVDRWLAGPQAWRLQEPPQPARRGRPRLRRVPGHRRRAARPAQPGAARRARRGCRDRPCARCGRPGRSSGPACPSGAAASRCRSTARPGRLWCGPSTCCASTTRPRSTRPGLRSRTGSPTAACWSTAPATSSGAAAPGSRSSRSGPQSLTLSWRLRGLGSPSEIAERLPKSLIHRNVEGEGVHAYLAALDRAWAHAAHHGSFGARQRFLATAAALREEGWPVLDGPSRWRLGELTVAWDAVAPRG